MKIRSLRTSGFLLISSLFSAMPTFAHAQASVAHSYTSMVVFGDSLVDAGNYFIASGNTYPDAADGFFQGRNTNGYDYTDQLSLKLLGTPTLASLSGGSNFAFGGARVPGGGFPDFATQISEYSAIHPAGGDANGLYVVTFGDNDVDAIDSGDYGGLGSRDAALRAAADHYAAGVKSLLGLGARNLLLTGFDYLDTASSHEAQSYLSADLADLALPNGANLMQYDIADFFERAASDPLALGLPAGIDTTTPCRAAGAAPDCAGYLFYDGDHPTAAAHTAILNDMNDRFELLPPVASVPETSTWLMMLGGFGMAGVALRRRRWRIALGEPSHAIC